MPEMPDVVASEPVAADWGNDIRDRTVQRYQDAAARDASVPFPLAGDLAYLDDSGTVTLFDGTTWKSGTAPGVYVLVTGDDMTGTLNMTDNRIGLLAPAEFDQDAVSRIFGDGRYQRLPFVRGSQVNSSRGNVAPPGFDVVWQPTGQLSLGVPAGWNTYDVIATGSVQTAGGSDTYQTRSRIQINGVAATSWNQSGNSAAHSLTTCSSTRLGLTGNMTVTLEAIMDNTGGVPPTVTKYAEVSCVMIRAT